MAGIGFQLKKLYEQKGYLPNAAAYFTSAVVIVGPMLICISIILLAKAYLTGLGASFQQIEMLTASIVYCFVFSMILTGGLTFLASRYISDCLFTMRLGDIIGSYHGAQAVALGAAAVAAAAFLWLSPLGPAIKLATYLLFLLLCAVWVDMVYVSAFREYARIIGAFLAGFAVMVALALLVTGCTATPPAEALLGAIAAGFFALHAMLAAHIRGFYSGGQGGGRGFLSYFGRHWALCLTGLLLTAAPYMHNFVFWAGPYGESVGGTYRYCPGYDIPGFYAILTVLPSIVMFVVSMETEFYNKYRNYFFLVLNEGIVHEIKLARKEMEDTLLHELARMMEIQLLCTFVSVVLGINLLTELGFTTQQTNCFTSLALGGFVYIFLDIAVLLLLYFDDRWGALALAAAYFTLNIVLSRLSLALGQSFFGYGYFVSGLLCLACGMPRLFSFVRNINYVTYCKQPLTETAAGVRAPGGPGQAFAGKE